MFHCPEIHICEENFREHRVGSEFNIPDPGCNPVASVRMCCGQQHLFGAIRLHCPPGETLQRHIRKHPIRTALPRSRYVPNAPAITHCCTWQDPILLPPVRYRSPERMAPLASWISFTSCGSPQSRGVTALLCWKQAEIQPSGPMHARAHRRG